MNEAIFYFFYNFAHQNSIIDGVIVFLAVYWPYLVVILAGLFLLFHHEVFRAENPYQVFLHKKKEILLVFITAGFAWVLGAILKLLIHIERPFISLPGVTSLIPETGFAFPSGHSTLFMALAVSIYLLHKKIGRWFIFSAVIIGLARISAGVHFPMDILGGFVLGALVAYFVKMYRMV